MGEKLNVEQFELGCLKNFDYLSFYNAIMNKNEKDEKSELEDDFLLEDYHHSLFYPILKYCVDILNSYDTKQTKELKYLIGIDYYERIYVSVGRQMYYLFFTGKKGHINNHDINFKEDRGNFDLKFVSKLNKTKQETFKEYFEIPCKTDNCELKKSIEKKASDLDLSFEQLIINKKKLIISRFLQGYSHQESILKSFESEIEGKGTLNHMPNLIFKRRNDKGKTVEEMDQIYLFTTKEETEKVNIDGFDVFYRADYSQEKPDYEVKWKGESLELENNNLYFIEIKKSIAGLQESYKRLNNIPINTNKSSETSQYKRENLTDLGNTFLTANIFANLIKKLINKDLTINILYIVDGDFIPEMVKIFVDSLLRDEVVLDKKYVYKINLIYTQPDLALKHFIQENEKKNKEIITLKSQITEHENSIKINEENLKILQTSMELMRIENEKIKLSQQRLLYFTTYKIIDNEVLEFCQNLINKKNLITIGIIDKINNLKENHKYSFPSIYSISYISERNLNSNYFLIDFNTFNYVNFKDLKNEALVKYSVECYEKDILFCKNFDEFYLLVDFVFMTNIRTIIKDKILNNYTLNIYMFENYYFMLYFKKEPIIQEEIKIHKNKCLNPMLSENSENLTLTNLEEFIKNYYDILIKRDFFKENKGNINQKQSFLFDFNNKINYILDLYIKDKYDGNYIQILSSKIEFNIYHDILKDELIKGWNYKNIIFVRKTEFGNKFEVNKIESIIKYLFNISNFKIENNTLKETSQVDIAKGSKQFGKDRVVTIYAENNELPFLVNSDLIINPNAILLIEYNYFISMPLLLTEQIVKPNILILSNDFGILNYYFRELYKDMFNISSFMEKQDNIIYKQNFFKINNDNVQVSNFSNLVNEKHKKKTSKIIIYDLIILESFSKKDKIDTSIPNLDVILLSIKLLTFKGILAFNLRTETFEEYKDILEKLKKKVKNIIEINLRPCSGFIIISQNEKIIFENHYRPINFFLMEKVIAELNKKIK